MQEEINSNMEYCIYLRKSRKDAEAEAMGSGETLARHESILLDFAKKTNLIIGKIYREIVSGDSISARPVMQELLVDVENGLWAGVLVIEVERLARGNTLDQGIVSNTFKYSSTKIITPTKTYDPNNEYDEEYFEFGLFMSRREYNTIKRRLHRGILASVKEGKTVASSAPYGYNKYKLKGKGYSLKPNENAKNVKLIFELYTSGKNLGEIIKELNDLKIPPPGNNNNGKIGKVWYKNVLQVILCNITYTGKIKYVDKQYLKKVVNGNLKLVKNPNPEVYIVDGLHEPIVSQELFDKAQKIYKSHQLADTRTKEQFELKNPLSTLLKCKACGKTLKRLTNGVTDIVRVGCKGCSIGSAWLNDVESAIIDELKIILADYELDLKQESAKSSIETQVTAVENQIHLLIDEFKKTESQKERLYDFLEQEIYDTNTFIDRSKKIALRLKEISNKIQELEEKKKDLEKSLEKKENIIPRIKNAIDTYYSADIKNKNKLLKSCVEKVEFYKPKQSRKRDDFQLIIYPRL